MTRIHKAEKMRLKVEGVHRLNPVEKSRFHATVCNGVDEVRYANDACGSFRLVHAVVRGRGFQFVHRAA